MPHGGEQARIRLLKREPGHVARFFQIHFALTFESKIGHELPKLADLRGFGIGRFVEHDNRILFGPRRQECRLNPVISENLKVLLFSAISRIEWRPRGRPMIAAAL